VSGYVGLGAGKASTPGACTVFDLVGLGGSFDDVCPFVGAWRLPGSPVDGCCDL